MQTEIVKKFKASKNDKHEIVTESQITEYTQSTNLLMLIRRLKIGEKIYHNDSGIEYERVE